MKFEVVTVALRVVFGVLACDFGRPASWYSLLVSRHMTVPGESHVAQKITSSLLMDSLCPKF